MASKALLYTIGAVLVISAGAIVISSGDQPGDIDCKGLDKCPVPIRQKIPFFPLEVAENATVTAPVTLTWTLTPSGIGNAHFHPNKGIYFEEQGVFACQRDATNDLVYVCVLPSGKPKKAYKYSIITEGIGSRDKDPFVVNN